MSLLNYLGLLAFVSSDKLTRDDSRIALCPQEVSSESIRGCGDAYFSLSSLSSTMKVLEMAVVDDVGEG